MDTFQFWLMKPLAELAMGIAITVVLVGLYLLYLLPGVIKQRLCKHDSGVSETRACDAICRKCRKNLGFIGTWHENNPRKD